MGLLSDLNTSQDVSAEAEITLSFIWILAPPQENLGNIYIRLNILFNLS